MHTEKLCLSTAAHARNDKVLCQNAMCHKHLPSQNCETLLLLKYESQQMFETQPQLVSYSLGMPQGRT